VTRALPIGLLDERYARLRIVHPAGERAVRESMRRLGQLMPIVACERETVFAVVDGFKRVTAGKALGFDALQARVMPLSEAAALAALVTFNRHGRGLSDLEEALVVQALCREHGLSQVEVAELLGRHKSWACRRLSLVERLASSLVDDVRSGLISTTIAREVARLPPGNQADVATSIHRHALTSHEAAQFVTLFAKTSGVEPQRHMLDKPREALEAHGRPTVAACDPRLGAETQGLHARLYGTIRTSSDLCARLVGSTPTGWTSAERQVLLPVLTKAHGTTELLLARLTEVATAVRGSDAA
jgi:ParB/RepB/Spo0J family partition protein